MFALASLMKTILFFKKFRPLFSAVPLPEASLLAVLEAEGGATVPGADLGPCPLLRALALAGKDVGVLLLPLPGPLRRDICALLLTIADDGPVGMFRF